MTAQEHYDHLLAGIYTWMTGDVLKKAGEFEIFCRDNHLADGKQGRAVDLGAGNGIQSIALARLGYRVTAIDFNHSLLNELKALKGPLPIEIIEADIRNISRLIKPPVNLIACCGDTLTHLGFHQDVHQLLSDCFDLLSTGSKLLLTFRDYSKEAVGTQHLIPVKSDEERILTCILDTMEGKVRVTDLVHEYVDGRWIQRVSSYFKLRISPSRVKELLEVVGFKLVDEKMQSGLVIMVAKK